MRADASSGRIDQTIPKDAAPASGLAVFLSSAHRPSQLVLARPPSRLLGDTDARKSRQGRPCGVCPAIGGRARPCCQAADQRFASPASTSQGRKAKRPAIAPLRRTDPVGFHRDGGIGAMRLVSSKRHADAPDRDQVDRQKCLAQHQPAAPSAPQELPAARRGTYGNAGGLACQAAKTSARLARSASRHSGNRLA
ncbi:hypothetical protein CKU38_00192 [Xanthomonas citri pv. fuscans]|nr:hypothetical protein CKU38_00192 [Xanthomonas citri pv. fuscans]